MYSAAEEVGLIEETCQEMDVTRSRISREELSAYLEALMNLHLYLQGTIMGLQKLNALVRGECLTIGPVFGIPLEPFDAPFATLLDYAVDALCWVGCYIESRERTELYCKLSGWRCGPLDLRTFPFEDYFDCLDWGQAERERFRPGLLHILYFTGTYLQTHELYR